MKKAISTSFYGEGNPNNSVSYMGCLETFKWKAVSYDGGPKKSGRYLTTDGRGHVKVLRFCYDDLETLFFQIIRHDFCSVSVIDGNEGGIRDVTDEDLMKLARSYTVWYDIYDDYEYGEYSGESITLFFDKDAMPKYYLDANLNDPNLKFGPIDEELDTYEAEETDFETW